MNQKSSITIKKFTIKKLIEKTNRSVDFITSQAFQSQQNDKKTTFYSKSMLCSARSTPKVSTLTSRYDLSNCKDSSKLSYAKKTSRTLRPKTNKSIQYNTHPLSQSMGTQYFANQNFTNELFLTQKVDNDSNHKENLHFRYQHFHKLNKSFGRQLKFEEFLYRLYLQKVKDLKGKANIKQQLFFIQKFKTKFTFYKAQKQEKMIRNINQLGSLIKQINLSNCDLGFNSMKCICEYIKSNKLRKMTTNQIDNVCYIKSIILDQNPLGDEGVIVLAQLITHCKLLEKLSLMSVNISQRGGRQLLRSLIGLQSLKEVNLSSVQGVNRNKFGQSIQQLQKVLNHNKCSIQTMNISRINFGNKGLKIIANGINHHNVLNELSIADNDIGIEEIPYFLSKTKLTHLTLLDMSNNKIGDQGFRVICEVIGNTQRSSSISRSIKSLNLSSNLITSLGIDSYCKTMHHNQSLTHLYLSNNQLSDGNMFSNFKYCISRNWTLKLIDFSHSFTNSDDIRQLFEGLEENRVLEQLILNKNNFSQQTFLSMINMLNVNKSLKSLHLQSCNLTDKIFSKYQKLTIQSKNIEHLNINNNYLTDKIGSILLKIINNTHSLTKLSLLKNCLSTKIQQQINYSLSRNKSKRQNSSLKIDDKQMQYLQYVAEIQARHQENIKNSIEKLQQKQSKAKLSTLLYQVVKVQIQEQQYQRQLQQQMIRIKHLQQNLNTNN